MRRERYAVYMVRCADGTYYAGYTNNLPKRIKRHDAGTGAKYVRGRGPVTLVYAQRYRSYKSAVHAERQLKKLTRREKEEVVRFYATDLRRRIGNVERVSAD